MLDVYWLLCVCIRTIEHADNTGSLFAFTPEFYLNVAMNAYSALKNYFGPANSMEELPGKTCEKPAEGHHNPGKHYNPGTTGYKPDVNQI